MRERITSKTLETRIELLNELRGLDKSPKYGTEKMLLIRKGNAGFELNELGLKHFSGQGERTLHGPCSARELYVFIEGMLEESRR